MKPAIRVMLAVLAGALSIGFLASPASADFGTSGNIYFGPAPASAGSYCGYVYGRLDFSLSAGGINVTGETYPTNGNPCTSSYAYEVFVPADYLEIQTSIRCRLQGGNTEFSPAGGTTASVPNPAYDPAVTGNPKPIECSSSNPGAYEARLVVTARYNVYPTGWQSHAYTTHWIQPAP